MRNILAPTLLSVLVGLGGLAPAGAQSLQLELGRDGPNLRVQEDCNPRYDDCRRYRREAVRIGCTEGRALDKAERMGVRRARVVSAGRRTVEVSGRDRGERVRITFSRAPGCPVVDRDFL